MAIDTVYVDNTIENGLKLATTDEMRDLLHFLNNRIYSIKPEQDRFRDWCVRADALYYSEEFTSGGADLWADDPLRNIPGRSHVSVNTPATYIDVPAALQAVVPIENMLATDTTEEARTAAAALERVRSAWKVSEKWDLKRHRAAVVKGLYGRTASKVYWDKDAEGGPRPCAEVVEQPRNLHLGYKTDDYRELEWAAYLTRMEPNAVTEEFGVEVQSRDFPLTEDPYGKLGVIPYVEIDTMSIARPARNWLNFGPARIEVWDYWYRMPLWKADGSFSKMETWNVVIAGNAIVRGPNRYPEYDGIIPYVPLFNTFLPGQPNGRSDLYDIEPLIREKYERITSGSQMIASGTRGDFWQLTGIDAPWDVPTGLKPKLNAIVAPGPGNRIETITPFIAQFQLEQYLGRLDREMATVSGLNDLLLGLAPAQVLSSSKAVNALISNYETRLSMRRGLLYDWDGDTWKLVTKVWVTKSKTVKATVDAGGGTLDIRDPSLSPRDEMETASRAANLVAAKLISQRTGMDWVGIDDPETEQDMIREESTDATLFPERVQIMAQLLSVLQQEGLQPNAATQGQAQGQLAQGQNDLRTALGAGTPQGTNATQGPDVQGQTPPIPGAPPEAGGPPSPFAQGPAGPSAQLQTMVQGGKATGRILTKRPLNGGR